MSWKRSDTAFAMVCGTAEAVLLIFDRPSAYIALGAFVYGWLLWRATAAFIPIDLTSEETSLKTMAQGKRLAIQLIVVAATLVVVFFHARAWFWDSATNAVIQQFSSKIGLGYGSSALPNFLLYVLIPGRDPESLTGAYSKGVGGRISGDSLRLVSPDRISEPQ